ncbi:MAG: 5-formyltetrahydrofolate cyclo-ligase [Planctomycetota bacterium]
MPDADPVSAMDHTDNSKAELRDRVRRLASAVSASDREAVSAEVCRRLHVQPDLTQAKLILAFAPLDDEPDVLDAIARWLGKGIRIAVPRVDWEASSMTAWLVNNMAEGRVGGLERQGPILQATTDLGRVDPSEIDAVLTPGVAFDASGGRLGRGGGFYDRFLPRCRRALRVGVAFDHQIVPETPMMDHDAPVDLVVTDRRLIEIDRSGR